MTSVAMEIDEVDKDSSEEELEKLVFGDSGGFLSNVKQFTLAKPRLDDGTEPLSDEDDEDKALEHVADADLFFLDEGPGTDQPDSDAVTALQPYATDDVHAQEPAVWEDSDDERLMVSLASAPRLRKLRVREDEDLINGKVYSERLQRQFERLHPVPEWAATARERARKRRKHNDGSSSESSGDESDGMDVDGVKPLSKLLQSSAGLTKSRKERRAHRTQFKAGEIDIQRTKDVPTTLPFALTSLSFHPTLPLLLSSGPSATLNLHHVDPNALEPNPLLTSLHIKRSPLTTVAFHPSPSISKIYLGAQRRYFHIWNLDAGSIEKITRIQGHDDDQRVMEHFSISPDGQYLAFKGTTKKGSGVVNILNAATCQWITQARIDDRVGIADFAWWSNSGGLSIAGKNGEVTEWSLGEQRALARWQDEGAVGTTVLALGGRSTNGEGSAIGDHRWVAMGSQSGIVNIYDRRPWSAQGNTETEDGQNLSIPARPSPVRVLDQLVTPVSHLKFSPDAQILVMASRWKRDALKLVHLPSCSVYRNWPTHDTPLGRISAVAWGQIDKGEAGVELMLAVGNEQGKIRLWEVRG